MQFSLFYFADYAAESVREQRYSLLIEGARYADARGFAAVWTPERHFHSFGGLYPNPSVTSAALAMVTERIGIRAGSVVVPLHHPLRIAEEWALVDNLSGGRAGVSLASGWKHEDFLLRPESYPERRHVTLEAVDTLRRLWRGEAFMASLDGSQQTEWRVFPPAVQDEIPLWLTSGGNTATFRAAGTAGVGVLTHLLGQSIDDLAANIRKYRHALAAARPGRHGHVTLMLHTYLDSDMETVERQVRKPLERYLLSALDLFRPSGYAGGPERTTEQRARFAIQPAYRRYLHEDGLFGSVGHAIDVVERLRGIGVDEIACLIDFGVSHNAVLDGLERLDELRTATMSEAQPDGVT
ncbi:MupA/Atu3671 family FMN-dependent luciferase-like monooxygenase [Micromonospora tulbaghiae]|uniref:MupA/Atu3671 family FMN-dependent luciferase-like monooxygenase n=1 Tax=Micromonospora tulbaghiae TaxID=479978 RepID=UPI003403C9F2